MALRPEQGYYNLPRFIGANYGETDEINCIPVFYPDTPEHKQLLGALLNIPALKASWFTSNDEQRAALAGIWQTAYLATMEKWQDEDTCMDCNSLIDCLENPDFVDALDALIAQLILDGTSDIYKAVMSATGSTTSTPVGLPPSDGYMSKDWAGTTNPGCDFDILYGQCLAIVVETNRTIVDVLEQMEVLWNAGELAQIIANFPVLAAASETAGADAVFGVIDKTLEFLAEGYIAAYNEEFETAVACSLFCASQSDCVITAEDIITVMYQRVQSHGTFPALGNIFDWIGWYTSNVVFGSAIADVAFWAAWSALGAMGSFFLKNPNVGVELTIQKAANNPDGDWIFCEDCNWCYFYDFTGANARGWSALDTGYGTQATLTSDGWEHNAIPSRITIGFTFPSAIAITGVRVERTEPTTAGDVQQQVIYTNNFATTLGTQSSTITDALYEFVASVTSLQIDVVTDASIGGGAEPVPGALFKVTLYGADGLPIILTGGEEC